MIRKIGKYQILERIGRGGMGMVYKARDPLLDRLVALKVIANDIDVTDEIRARFFREAQACARLNHPNIVTVYDMGEEEGQLYIVMEFLEGRELRQLIAARPSLLIEDKLAVMVQVCEGLHYAHQQGIIHRDVKPGNIFVLRNGLVKILDFGLAHIATETNLTRTGLVVGTLRYISPEQVRGRADHRSDIFSVGAVFYELLTLRPPFGGPDPMQILEQLRSEEPPSPSTVDPTIPTDLSAIVERALRKEPAQRFADLGEMRGQLEGVRRRFGEEAQRLRAEVEAKLGRIRDLETALAAHLGAVTDATSPIAVDGQARVATLETLNQSLGKRIERLQALLEKAEALRPVYERGQELMRIGKYDEAVTTLEGVMSQLPEHEPAVSALAEARRQVEEGRRRAEVRRRLEEAAAALSRGAFAESLETIKGIDELAAAAGLTREVVELRGSATAALTAQQDEVRRQRARAEAAAALTSEGRTLAEEVEAFRRAERAWLAAEAKAADAGAAFDQNSYAQAAVAYDEATALYHRAEEESRETVRREQQEAQRREAERTRQRWLRGREAADAVGARERAQALWAEAELKAEHGRAAFDEAAYTRAAELFDQAVTLGRQATDVAREAVRREETEREQREARIAQDAAQQARTKATVPNAAERAAGRWGEAEAKLGEAEAALGQASYLRAKQLFGAAVTAFAAAEQSALHVLGREREATGSMRARMVDARDAAQAVASPQRAASQWAAAETKAGEGETWLGRERYREATQAFEAALTLFREAEAVAREVLGHERARAEQVRIGMAPRRVAAVAQAAAEGAAAPWGRAEAKAAEAESAFADGRYIDAAGLFETAAALYEQAEREGREAIAAAEATRQEEARRAAEERARHAELRAHLDEAGNLFARSAYAECLARLQGIDEQAAALGLGGEVTELRQAVAAALADQEAARLEELRRQRVRAEEAGALATEGRSLADEVEAPRRAEAQWLAAETKSAEAKTAFEEESFAMAATAYDEARSLYRRAEAEAREAERREQLDQQRREAERTRQRLLRRREAAEAVGARERASAVWGEADRKFEDGQTAFAQAAYTRATELFDQAIALARQAAEDARQATRRDEVDREQREMDLAQESARQARVKAAAPNASQRAAERWQEAEAKLAEADTSLSQGNRPQAKLLFEAAAGAFAVAEQTARERLDREGEGAEAARTRLAQARDAAQRAEASHQATTAWAAAEARAAEGEALFGRADYVEAQRVFDAALPLFQDAERQASEALARTAEQQRQRESADRARERMHQARAAATGAETLPSAQDAWQRGEARAAAGVTAVQAEQYQEALQAFDDATSLFRQAEAAVRSAAHQEELRQGREAAGRSRERMASARAAAAQTDAPRRAADLWSAAEARSAAGSEAFGREEYALAGQTFEAALDLYQRAEGAARDTVRQQEERSERERAEQARQVTARRRATTSEFRPEAHAPEAWGAAEAQAAEAEALLVQRKYGQAAQIFTRATEAYRRAEEAARRALADRERSQLPEVPTGSVPAPSLDVVGTEASQSAEPAVASAPASDVSVGAAVRVPGQRIDGEVPVTPARTGSRRLLLAGVGAGALILAVVALVPVLRGGRSTPDRETVQPPSPAPTVASPDSKSERPPQGAGQPSGDPVTSLDQIRKQMAAARENAVKAESERLVPKPWAAAAAKERAAVVALGQGRVADAEGLYREAVDGYLAAANEARALKDASVQKQEGSRRLQDQASAARRAAELALAPKLAVDQWGKAASAEQAAQNARDRGDYEKAGSLYRDATAAFQEAEKEALRQASAAEGARLAKLKEDLQAAEQARTAAASARGDALAQEAPTYAAQALAQGQQREKDGEAAFTKQDYGNAKDSFAAARKDYEAAAAQSAKLKGERQAADQARTAAVAARGDALAQEAQTYAAQALARGQQREKEGEAALIRQDFRVARDSFQAARTDYGTATDAARRERTRLRDALKAEVNQARTRANSIEQQAVKLEAEKLAREPLQAGRSKEREAEGLLAQENFPAARQAFQDATQRYSEAVSTAQSQRDLRGQADQAKAAMLTAKQAARSDSGDYASAAAQERQAGQFYDRLAFKESADAFRAAGDLYARAVPPKPSPPPPSPPAEPRPAPVARTGSVLVTSNVAGAEVKIGDYSFQTQAGSVEVGSLSVGRYPVRARLDGYKEWTGEVEVVQGRRSALTISLEALPPPPKPAPAPGPARPRPVPF